MGSHSSRNQTRQDVELRIGKAAREGGWIDHLGTRVPERDAHYGAKLAAALDEQGLVVFLKTDVNKEFLRRAITKELGIGAQAHNHHFNSACAYCTNRAVTAVLRQLGLEP